MLVVVVVVGVVVVVVVAIGVSAAVALVEVIVVAVRDLLAITSINFINSKNGRRRQKNGYCHDDGKQSGRIGEQ